MTSRTRRGRSDRGGRPARKLPVRAETRPRNGPAEPSQLVVGRTLATYAARGVFRAYGDQPSGGGKSRFSFRWHADATFHLVYDPSRRELVFSDLLPSVASRSAMYRELRAFIDARSSPAVPEHRRIDRRKARVAVINRRGMVSLVVSLEAPHLEYGVRKAVNLIHELFVEFLRSPLYFPYMVEHFQLDPDL